MNKDLSQVYGEISQSFSATRQHPWAEFAVFSKLLPEQAKVLDLGCGNGRLRKFLPAEISYTGVDFTAELLDIAQKQYPHDKFRHGKMQSVKTICEGEKFDGIFLIASFHHLASQSEREQLLADLHDLLNEGGKIFISNWNLYQKKYWKSWLANLGNFLARKAKWGDLQIPYQVAGKKHYRYYYAFSLLELHKLFAQKSWKVEQEFYTRGQKIVLKSSDAYNFCHVLSAN